MERHEESLSTSDLAATRAERPVDEVEQDRAEPRFERDDAATSDEGAEVGSLLPQQDDAELRVRWEEIQTRFVDDPRQAVEEADALVAGVMQSLAEGFAQAREQLEGQWSRGEDVGTEDLRVALQRYRSFFQRLLSA
jgi:hypothetical protein